MSHINNAGSGGGGTGGAVYNVTLISVANSPYTVLTTDEFIGVNTTGGQVTVKLPNSPSVGTYFIIKDIAGGAAVNNILVTTVGGVDSIDGTSVVTMNTAYESLEFIYTGTGDYYIF